MLNTKKHVQARNRMYLFSQYFHPELISTGQLLTELCQALAERGWNTIATAARPSYYGRGRADAHIDLADGRVRVIRVPTTQMNKNRFVGKVFNYASTALLFTVRQLFVPTNANVIVVTNPAVMPVLAAVVAAVRRQRLIVLVHDVYPEIVAALGYLSAKSIVFKVWRMLDAWAHRHATRVVVLGRDMERVVIDRQKTLTSVHTMIAPNWSDIQPLTSREREFNPILDAYPQLRDKFIVLYSGNIGLFHPIEALVRCAVRVRDRGLNRVLFVFIGGGGKLSVARDLAHKHDLANVCFLPYQEREMLPYSIGVGDIGIVSLSSGVDGLAVPSKLYGIMAAGKPVLANVPVQSEVAYVVTEARCGIVCDPEDDEALADAIEKYCNDPTLLDMHGRNARVAVDERYNLKKVAEQYESLLSGIGR